MNDNKLNVNLILKSYRKQQAYANLSSHDDKIHCALAFCALSTEQIMLCARRHLVGFKSDKPSKRQTITHAINQLNYTKCITDRV